MKVKNIMFSGVMAAILMGTAGAHAATAVQIASQKYVENQVADKATRTELSEGLAAKADKTAFESLQSAVNSTESGLGTKAAQASLDQTNAYIGTIPNTATATNIVAYVQEKTAGIATDTALEELTGRVATTETDIDGLQDKVGDVSVADRIATSLADYTTTANLQKDYLTKADATNTYATKTTIGDLGAHETVVAYVGDAVQQVNANLGGVQEDVDEALEKADTNTGLIEGLTTDVATLQSTVGNAESGLVKGVADNAAAIATEESRAKAAEEALDGRVGTLETTVNDTTSGVAANAAAITTLNSGADVEGSVDNKIKVKADTLLNRPTTNTCGANSGLCVLTMSNEGDLVWIDVTDPATE